MKSITITVSNRVGNQLSKLQRKTGACPQRVVWIAVQTLVNSLQDEDIIELIKQKCSIDKTV